MMRFTFPLIALILAASISGCSENVRQEVAASDCQTITFQQINDDPHQFVGERICLEGYLNSDFYRWQIYGSGQENTDLLHRGVDIGITQSAEIATTWSSGDIARVSGIFHLVELCWISKTIRQEQDIYLESAECNNSNTPFNLIETTATVTARSDDLSNCTEIDFEEISAAPLSYAYQMACMEAIIQVEFEGMGLYAPPAITERYPRLLSPSLGYREAANLGYRTGDLVFVRGYLLPSEGCISPDGFCIGGSDLHFRNFEIEFVSRIPAREQCTNISIDGIEISRDNFNEQMICTEGEIALSDFRFYLIPVGFEGEIVEGQNFDLDFLFIDEVIQKLLPGDIVSIAALTWQNRMKLYEIDVLETTPIFELCETPSLADVLVNPNEWIDKVVCMEGYLQPEYADWTYFLLDADEPPIQAAPTLVAVGAYYPDEGNTYSGDGEAARAAGILYESWGCRATDESLEVVAAAHEAGDHDDLCPPANRSLMFDIYEVE